MESSKMITVEPDDRAFSAEFWSIPDHAGLPYDAVLAALHRTLRPKSYMEIGTATGSTLRLAGCATIAVDPQFQIEGNVIGQKPNCQFYQMTSDEFFENFNPSTLLGRAVDLAFLDGFHIFEYLLRDFINTELSCKRNSVILMHDCIPTDAHAARRRATDQIFASVTRYPHSWAGDVWKVGAILQDYRPDIRLYFFNSPPTGLLAATNLDPHSEVLHNRYFDIVDKFSQDDGAEAYLRNLDMHTTDVLLDVHRLAKLFWL
jgi:hypothetical protein